MDKQKVLKLLNIMGMVFIIAAVIGFFQMKEGRKEILKDQIPVPKEFTEQFSRVITKTLTEELPNIQFSTPTDELVSWDHFEGEYTLINFWASWCAPCVVELPSLDKLRQRFDGKGLRVVAISLDQQRDHEYIKNFLNMRNINEFAAYYDINKDIKRSVPMRGIPTTYLLNAQGKILYIFEGDAHWQSPAAILFFKALTAEKDK